MELITKRAKYEKDRIIIYKKKEDIIIDRKQIKEIVYYKWSLINILMPNYAFDSIFRAPLGRLCIKLKNSNRGEFIMIRIKQEEVRLLPNSILKLFPPYCKKD
jgi:hypothetical protein